MVAVRTVPNKNLSALSEPQVLSVDEHCQRMNLDDFLTEQFSSLRLYPIAQVH